jgi:hypothetical protein
MSRKTRGGRRKIEEEEKMRKDRNEDSWRVSKYE